MRLMAGRVPPCSWGYGILLGERTVYGRWQVACHHTAEAMASGRESVPCAADGRSHATMQLGLSGSRRDDAHTRESHGQHSAHGVLWGWGFGGAGPGLGCGGWVGAGLGLGWSVVELELRAWAGMGLGWG